MAFNPIRYFTKPEYLFHPSQVWRRLSRIGKPVPAEAIVRLPWGADVLVRPGDNITAAIYYYGIFDKIVPEAVWRLLDRGETSIDVGANVGQNASLMASRVGREGHVIAFEPHPEIFNELKANFNRSHNPTTPFVQLENVALGEKTGVAWLVEGREFDQNSGTASLLANAESRRGIQVKIGKLDQYLEAVSQVGVCKIDVEGNELAVLQGTETSLKRRVVRDIVFEDFNSKPSPVTALLQQHGFTLFELQETWLKPRLQRFGEKSNAPYPGFTYNYLATLNPERAVNRFKLPGWRCLMNW